MCSIISWSTLASGTEYVLSSICSIWEEHYKVIIAVGLLYCSYKLWKYISYKRLRNKWNSAGKDVVVLHFFPRTHTMPNMSPFALKLETFLKITKIKYVIDSTTPLGPKKKCPWITINGQDYSDSQLIIEFLKKKFDKDLQKSLKAEDQAISTAFRVMADEHMFWCLEWWWFLGDPDIRVLDFFFKKVPWYYYYLIGYYRRPIRKNLWSQGLGRHSEKEIIHIIKHELKAISDFLGNKPYLLGNEPCEADCSLFGVLAQFVWVTPGSPVAVMLQDEFRNITQYCNRIRQNYWPDWDKCLAK